MIIVRAPIRISLAGGGTDLPEFYDKNFGAVVSFGINKYVTVLINPKFDKRTRVSYSVTENVDKPEELQHDLIRAALGYFAVRGVEIVTVSDIPGEGSGLGSSSALAVALCLGLRKHTGQRTNLHPSEFAEEAYKIERTLCIHPVGKQDHYASAYGGLHFFHFNPRDEAIVQSIKLTAEQARFLENDLCLFYTGTVRSSKPILGSLQHNLTHKQVTTNLGLQLRDMAVELDSDLLRGDFEKLPYYLHEGWEIKKRMAEGVSDPALDEIYNRALRAGAGGGKLCGAGGGGFFLFAGCWNKQSQIERALGLRRVPFKIAPTGVKIVYAEAE